VSLNISDKDRQQWRCFKCLSEEVRRSSELRAIDTPGSRTSALHSEKSERGANTANQPTKFRDPVQSDSRPANTLKAGRSIHKSNATLPNRSLERSGGSATSRVSKGPQAMSDSHSGGISGNDAHAKTPQPIPASRKPLDDMERKRSSQDLHETSRSRDVGVRHRQSQTCLGRTDISNTPSQTSSQTKRQSPTVVVGADELEDMHALELGSTPLEPTPNAKTLSKISLCTVCLKQHILAKPGVPQIIWQVTRLPIVYAI
jgi:hypothetical protein